MSHRIVNARVEAEKVARGKQNMQKLAAMLKWRLVLPREAPSSLATLEPPVVGPDGAAYVVVRKESRLHALDSAGHLKWSFSGVISADPAVAPGGSTVYVVGTAHSLFALDQASGQARWSTQFSNGLDLICTGPALAADGTIYTLTQRNPFSLQLNALTPDGKLLWQVTEPSEKMCSTQDIVEMAPQLIPLPIVAGDGTIYFTHEGTLFAVDPRGVAKWSALTERPIARVLLGKHGEVYTYAEKLTAFDASGRQQWTGPWRTALWLHPDIGEDGTIYLVDSTEYTRKLVAINPDGSEKWIFTDDPAIQAFWPVLTAPYTSTPATGPSTRSIPSSTGWIGTIRQPSRRASWSWPRMVLFTPLPTMANSSHYTLPATQIRRVLRSPANKTRGSTALSGAGPTHDPAACCAMTSSVLHPEKN
jgi:outer membrane protein assembly factor BamB